MCYVCKTDFHELHHFYDQMCPPCAELNYAKREQTADLRGRVVLVTGARVKIGYQAAVKLLRAGAEVIVATRFPRDAARRFGREPDALEWTQRLHVYGIDLRHTPSVELLARHLLATQPRLDGAHQQRVPDRAPAERLVRPRRRERGRAAPRPPFERAVLERNRALLGGGRRARGCTRGAAARSRRPGLWKSAVLSQVPLLAEDLERGGAPVSAGPARSGPPAGRLRDFNTGG